MRRHPTRFADTNSNEPLTIKSLGVKDVISSHVEVVRPDFSIAEAAKKMKSLDVYSA
jgi:CBS domain-containing protein